MRLLLLLFAFAFCFSTSASDLKIESIEWSFKGRDNYKVKCVLSWNNSWYNNRNHDAVWLFLKYANTSSQPQFRHVKLLSNGHKLLQNQLAGSPSPVFEVPEDRVGLFIYPAANYRGKIRWSIELSLDTAILSDPNFAPNNSFLNIHGIEMVHIPEGAFTAGEADTAAAWNNYALFIADENGRPGGLWKIQKENETINVGKQKGYLYYNSQTKIYHGDQQGVVTAEFPKGFQSFYIMKYETTQGQYADFLNAISGAATASRANFGSKDYYTYRGTIYFKEGKYLATSPNRPCNFFSWDDACAYADWAGLRPLTELEFEKACRGPLLPIPHEFPWNSDSKNKLQRIVSENDELVFTNGLNEADLNDNNREQFGASYYWVMDLAGSLWERCVTIGDSIGRAFKGSHGDGMLAPYGFASNADWPKGSTETAGFGFRGGGYYEHHMQYGGFNPHSPIGYRNFGSWPGGARSLAYGSRFVRTVISTVIIK